MLNKNVINVLQTLNGVTNSAILKYPITVINNIPGDVVVKVNMETLDTEAFPELGIYNLSEFISTFKLFDEYQCNISDNVVLVTGGGKSLQYLATNTSVLETFNKEASLFAGTAKAPSICSFELTTEDIKSVKSAAGIFKDLSDVVIEAKDNDIEVKLSSDNNFNSRSNSFSIRKPGIPSDKEFSIRVPVENFNNLPQSNYKFDIKYNAERNAYRLLLTSLDIDIQIIMAIKIK